MFEKIRFKKDYDFGSLHGYKVEGVVSFYVETKSRDDLKKIITTCKKKTTGTGSVFRLVQRVQNQTLMIFVLNMVFPGLNFGRAFPEW